MRCVTRELLQNACSNNNGLTFCGLIEIYNYDATRQTRMDRGTKDQGHRLTGREEKGKHINVTSTAAHINRQNGHGRLQQKGTRCFKKKTSILRPTDRAHRATLQERHRRPNPKMRSIVARVLLRRNERVLASVFSIVFVGLETGLLECLG